MSLLKPVGNSYRSGLDLEDSQRISAGFAKFGGVEATIGHARHEDFSDSPYLSRRAAFLGRRPDGHAIRAVSARGEALRSLLYLFERDDAVRLLGAG